MLLTKDQETTNTCIQHYKAILRQIYDSTPLIPQIRKSLQDQSLTTSLTSNFLCLQCPIVMKEGDIAKHGNKKGHRFCTWPVEDGVFVCTRPGSKPVLTFTQLLTPGVAPSSARCVMISSGIRPSRT